MEQWQYDPAQDLAPTHLERLRGFPYQPKLLLHSVRALAAVVLRCWLRLYHRFTIVGRQNLPTDRSFVLIANHASHLDTLCLLSALPLGWLHRAFPTAARDYFFVRAPWARLAALVFNALPFDRHFAPGSV
jgi:1-acyl-sn-glycerol-3-phosphate acyltransferase